MVLCTLTHGFFGNKQYTAITPNRLMMKLSKLLCLECSTCAMCLSSSFTVSIMALFLSKNLSKTLINAPFMLLFNLVISCILSTKLTPMHLPNKTFLINEVRGKLHPFPILLYGYKKQLLETDGEAACILFQDRNV